MSSQSPWIVEGQSGWIAAGGCAGGSRIISTNVQVVRNILVSVTREEPSPEVELTLCLTGLRYGSQCVGLEI